MPWEMERTKLSIEPAVWKREHPFLGRWLRLTYYLGRR